MASPQEWSDNAYYDDVIQQIQDTDHSKQYNEAENSVTQQDMVKCTNQQQNENSTPKQDVEKSTNQQNIENQVSQQDVEKSTNQQNIENQVSQQDVEKSTNQQNIENQVSQQDVEKSTNQQNIENQVSQQHVEKSTNQQNIENQVSQQDVEKSTNKQNIENQVSQQDVEKSTNQQNIENQVSQQDVKRQQCFENNTQTHDGKYPQEKCHNIHGIGSRRNIKRQCRKKRKQPVSSSEFSSSDELPLTVLLDKQAQGSPESFLDSEDSYKPRKKDQNTSDSEYSSSNYSSDNLDILLSKNHSGAKKGRKSTKSCTRQNPNKNQNVPKRLSPDNQLEIDRAKEASRIEFMRQRLLQKVHQKRLDNLLFSNGLKRKSVEAYGNCFFEAAVLGLPCTMSPQDLRQKLCDHMENSVNTYIGFFNTTTSEEPESDGLLVNYYLQIENLRQNGFWVNRAADVLPLALANWSQQAVRIYSSNPQKPVIEVHPTSECLSEAVILLAYTESSDSAAHYDACEKLSPNEGAISKSGQEQTLMDSSPSVSQYENTTSPLETTAASVNSPRKSASFMTPPKRKRNRKRKATPENWKKNIRKKLRLTGQEYVNQKGQTVKEKHMKTKDCSKCRYNCSSKISDEKRKELFQTFWNLGTYERQKDFVCSQIEEKTTRTYLDENEERVSKRRNVFRTYSFEVDGEKQQVCKAFFLASLAIGEAYVNHAMANKSGGVYNGTENRGKHRPHNKTKESLLQKVRQHIESFPKVEGHYTRQDSNRHYLGAELNITRMYELYKEKHCKDEDGIVGQQIYRRVFNEEYNFSFHVPKKDQCSLCTKYNRDDANGIVSEQLREACEIHQKRKTRAREEKEKDKNKAKVCNNMYVATFDLQAVLSTPCSLVSQIYYMRKLNCYNLTFYNLVNKSGTCYLWSEVDANRGSCEIASCLRLQMLSLPQNITNVVLYSDACTGQNRNQFIASCCLHAVNSIDHIQCIDHKFLESGHTQMECDSMHSAIEFAKTKTEIFVPSQWDTVIRMARRKDPYVVVPIRYSDIWDFKQVRKQTIRNTKIDTAGTRVNWMNMKWLQFLKEEPDTMRFKYDYDEEFRIIKFNSSGSKRGRPTIENLKDLPRKYQCKQSISDAKKKDLLTLCKTGVIPEDYHGYYMLLPCGSNVVDKLPQPDAEEEDIDTDQE